MDTYEFPSSQPTCCNVAVGEVRAQDWVLDNEPCPARNSELRAASKPAVPHELSAVSVGHPQATPPSVADLPANDDLIREASSAHVSHLSFTGERVIPGAVETQLWNEHVSRYRFACLLARGKRVLDAGCGSGYGSQLLAHVADHTVGIDVSGEATSYAANVFSRADYAQASVTALPLKSRSFDLVTAFEVIEHLKQWRLLLDEAARVLDVDGVFLVSTPNTEYYAEARGPSGPNPYHVHEFGFQEFRTALERVFPFVEILSQNQQEAIIFSGAYGGTSGSAFVPPVKDSADAHFFVAVCSFRPVTVPVFADVSSTHNLLRERERHIRGLQGEVRERDHHIRGLQQQLATTSEQLSAEQERLASVEAQLAAVQQERATVQSSGWIRLGRILGLGPWSEKPLSRARRLVASWLEPLRSPALWLATPFLLFFAAASMLVLDLCFALVGRRRVYRESVPDHSAASIVIPNWNGVDLLRANLPSVVKAAAATGSEVIVVDNASCDDSVLFLRSEFPNIRILELSENAGFAGACNRGAEDARNDVVVFLNNDMRVEEDFLGPLLRNFEDPLVFAVTSQIYFADPSKRREETGLTELRWEKGQLHVGHRVDPLINTTFPCAYPGGGSSAFDKSKFIELGGFDSLFHPFYYEDTDLGYMAWKHGWKVLYEPSSIVYHKHRGTISKVFSPTYIDGVVRKNSILYCWKNVHDWKLLTQQLWVTLASALSKNPHRATVMAFSPEDVRQAVATLKGLARSRWRALERKMISDKEALRRPLGGYYRDRFMGPQESAQERLNVLLVSPYPIEPAVHGGAVFMREAVYALASLANVHLLSFVDREDQLPAQEALIPKCTSALFLVRPHLYLQKSWTLTPAAIREFGIRDFAWAMHRTILLERIDVLQLEYTMMGQYAGEYNHIPCMLFEHDISSQSLWRRIRAGEWNNDLVFEFLRMRIYEPKLLRRVTRVQVCSHDNARSLSRLARGLSRRIDADMRAAIDVAAYEFSPANREPDSLLFIGSFRHLPNVAALEWFVAEVFPSILKDRPSTVLNVVGSDLPEVLAETWKANANIKVLGQVPDVKVPLKQYSVFVCPVLSGSGVRVKLLEAFASGIPAVATRVGAEGLSSDSLPICEIADSAPEFAGATLRLLNDEKYRGELAARARASVEQHRDSRQAITRLEAVYRNEVNKMRRSVASSFRAALPQE